MSGFAAASKRAVVYAGFFCAEVTNCFALNAITPKINATMTINPPQPASTHTRALVFCGAAGATPAGGGAGATGPPGCGIPALPACAPALLLAGAPQFPQNGPVTCAPQFVQYSISPSVNLCQPKYPFALRQSQSRVRLRKMAPVRKGTQHVTADLFYGWMR